MKLTLLSRKGLGGRPLRKRRGQAVIEMALVMTVLLTLTFGLVDFGMFLTGYIRASTCAREVARAAVVRDANALTRCDDHQLTPLFENVTVTMNPNPWVCATPKSAVTATVTGTYRWKALIPVLNAFFPGPAKAETIATTTKVTMRMEALQAGTC